MSTWQTVRMARQDELGFIQEPLMRSHRLAALGEIALGIAHEINTPLGIIGQEVELLRHHLGQHGEVTPESDEYLRQIQNQVDRCAEIIHSLLSLASTKSPIPQKADATSLVDGMVTLMEREVRKKGITIQRHYPKSAFGITTDPPLLRQVVLNLLNNAAQAITDRGEIHVTVCNEGTDFWLLSVRDNGCGIPAEDIARIFNPFYTTKQPGVGSGLGLTITASIVSKLGGFIEVGSTQGLGAEFIAHFPVKDTGREAATSAASPAQKTPARKRKRK